MLQRKTLLCFIQQIKFCCSMQDISHRYMQVMTDTDFGILEKHCLYYAAILGASLWATWITWMPFLHVRHPPYLPCCNNVCLWWRCANGASVCVAGPFGSRCCRS